MANHFLREWSDDHLATIPEPHILFNPVPQWDALDELIKEMDAIDAAIEAHELALASVRAVP